MSKSDVFPENLGQTGILPEAKFGDVKKRVRPERVTGEAVPALTPRQGEKLPSSEWQGLVLGQYDLLEELGRGGFGCVYKARHRLMDRVVAIKLISNELVADERARKRFRREVLALTRLSHPNIVMAFDADQVEEQLFLVMEFVDGPNLQELVRARGPLGIGLACSMLQQAARALQHAHEMGLIHRDIKPANLLVPSAGLERWATPAAENGQIGPVVIKVGDLGLAQLPRHGQSSHFSRDKNFVGTPDYVSPEQARNRDLDIRSDLYSLGCTFYFALTGQKPFAGTHALEIVVQHLEKEAAPLEVLRPEIPPAVSSIVRRLMAKDPDKRFQTPMDLISELTFLVGRDPLVFAGSMPNPPTFPKAATSVEPQDTPTPTKICESPVEPIDKCFPPSLDSKADVQFSFLAPMPEISGAASAEASLRKDLQSADEDGAEDPPESLPARQCRTTSEEDFALFWREWKTIVARLQKGKSPGIDPHTYRLLHDRLVDFARFRSDADSRWRRLQSLVEPWVGLETLAITDAQSLDSLLRNIRHVETALEILGKSWTWFYTLTVFTLILLFSMLAGFIALSSR